MKRWKKIVLSIAALMLVAAACVLSWTYGFRKGMLAAGMTTEGAELGMFYTHMDEQMRNADCEGAKFAISEYLKILEKYKSVDGALITETSYYGDKMLYHVTLARIERQLGNEAKAAQHMAVAKEVCANRKWKHCSEEEMTRFARRVEEKHPIACLANEK